MPSSSTIRNICLLESTSSSIKIPVERSERRHPGPDQQPTSTNSSPHAPAAYGSVRFSERQLLLLSDAGRRLTRATVATPPHFYSVPDTRSWIHRSNDLVALWRLRTNLGNDLRSHANPRPERPGYGPSCWTRQSNLRVGPTSLADPA
jgi:hypothetical protein